MKKLKFLMFALIYRPYHSNQMGSRPRFTGTEYCDGTEMSPACGNTLAKWETRMGAHNAILIVIITHPSIRLQNAQLSPYPFRLCHKRPYR